MQYETSVNDTNATVLSDSSHSELDKKLIASWKHYLELPLWLSKNSIVLAFSIGIFVNMLILFYFFKSGKYRIPIFALFTSLAMTDFGTCLGNVAMAGGVYPLVLFPVAATELSILSNFVMAASYAVSICHLVFLAALRYYQLCYPLQAKVRVTTTWVVKWCIFMWILGSGVSMPLIFSRDIHVLLYNNRTLKLYIFDGNFQVKEMLNTIFAQVAPLVIITLLHMLKLYKTSHRQEVTTTEHSRRNASSTAAAMIIIVFVLSLLLRLGHSFYHGALGFPFQKFHKMLAISGGKLSFSNSIVDPFLYLLGSAEIRREIFMTFFPCGAKKV